MTHNFVCVQMLASSVWSTQHQLMLAVLRQSFLPALRTAHFSMQHVQFCSCTVVAAVERFQIDHVLRSVQ
jgi:hypothetical protein